MTTEERQRDAEKLNLEHPAELGDLLQFRLIRRRVLWRWHLETTGWMVGGILGFMCFPF